MKKIVRCNENDYSSLSEIWERSVRATHDFLTEKSIEEIRSALIPEYFRLAGEMIEMLFVDADCRGLGYGSMLLDFAKANGATRVDVNQQNPSALLFYISKGFHIIGLDDTDEAGRPYPILHLSL